MLEGLRSDVFAVKYYAAAGLNLCAEDPECVRRVVQTNSEAYLHAMLKTSTDERLKRFVAGALATIGEVKQTMSQRPTPRARPAGLSFTIEG